MIVTCQNCDRTFELDDLGVPEEGAQMLCPECKEPFSISAANEDSGPSEEILEATLLPEDDFSDLGEALDDSGEEAEIDAPALGGEDRPPVESVPEKEQRQHSGPTADERGGPSPAKKVAIGAIDLESVPASSLKSRSVSLPGSGDTRKRFGKLGRGLGWGIALGLLAMALTSVFRQGSDSMASVEQTLEVGAFRVESLRGEWVDTMAGRTLMAVTGNLHNPSDAPKTLGALLEVSLVGPDDRRLAWPPASMGVRISEREVRELPLTLLENAQKQAASTLAQTKVPPRGSIPVQAIFFRAPPDAVRFALGLGASVGSGQGD